MYDTSTRCCNHMQRSVFDHHVRLVVVVEECVLQWNPTQWAYLFSGVSSMELRELEHHHPQLSFSVTIIVIHNQMLVHVATTNKNSLACKIRNNYFSSLQPATFKKVLIRQRGRFGGMGKNFLHTYFTHD